VSRKVNIGIIQMNSKLGDVELNISRALKFIQKAVEMKANIVCLPELFSTGYNMKILAEKNAEIGLRYYNYIVDRISNTAKENKIFLRGKIHLVWYTIRQSYLTMKAISVAVMQKLIFIPPKVYILKKGLNIKYLILNMAKLV